MSASRLLVKLTNRDHPLVFGVTDVDISDSAILLITLWEPVNEALLRTIEVAPDGWDWIEYEADVGEPPDPRGHIENPAKAAP